MRSHGPDLNEEARLTEQIHRHLDTIERQADMVSALTARLAEASKRLPVGIRTDDG